MTELQFVSLILALVCMAVSVKPPVKPSINWMTASFTFIILTWVIGVGNLHTWHFN
jgi:hypothetical protein